MSEQRLKELERLLVYILLAAAIVGIISQLTGCGEYFRVESKTVIDYRFTEAHTETSVDRTGDYPIYRSDFKPDKYELLWLYTYQDGHKERKWEECTRFEYNDAQKELGE